MKTTEISNTDDIIDSRDVIARIEYLESEEESAKRFQVYIDRGNGPELDGTWGSENARFTDLDEAEEAADQLRQQFPDCSFTVHDEMEPEWLESEEAEELKALRELAEEASGYAADWKYGEALIRDSYFKEYAEQFADDIGAIDRSARWPNDCIDWDRAARELQMDYNQVDFAGAAYWIR